MAQGFPSRSGLSQQPSASSDEGADHKRRGGCESERKYKRPSSKRPRADQLRPAEVLEALADMQERADKEWLADVLVQCQELVLKAMLASLQPSKKASSPQPSKADRRRKAAKPESDLEPASEEEQEIAPPPKKSSKLADPRHSTGHAAMQVSTPHAHALPSVPFQGMPGVPAPPQPLLPSRQSARHAEAVSLFSSQRHGPMQHTSAVEASAVAALQQLHQGDASAGQAEGTTRRPKPLGPKAQWPPEMAAVVAEEMMAADQANRTINFRLLLSKLGDSYTEKQVKTKIDTLRKQQRRHPNGLLSVFLPATSGGGAGGDENVDFGRYPSSGAEDEGDEQVQGDEQEYQENEAGDDLDGEEYDLLRAIDAPRAGVVVEEGLAEGPRGLGGPGSWLPGFRTSTGGAPAPPPQPPPPQPPLPDGAGRGGRSGTTHHTGRTITTVMVKQEPIPRTVSQQQLKGHRPAAPAPVPPPPRPPPAAADPPDANGEQPASPSPPQPAAGQVVGQRQSARRQQKAMREQQQQQQQQLREQSPAPQPPPAPEPPQASPRSSIPPETSVSLRQKIQDMLQVAPENRAHSVEGVVGELLSEPGFQRLDPHSLRKEVASILSSTSDLTTAPAEQAVE